MIVYFFGGVFHLTTTTTISGVITLYRAQSIFIHQNLDQ